MPCGNLQNLAVAGTKERSSFEEEVNYLMNIIENIGGDLTRQCYWDFGRWSDLWRVWRQPGIERIPGDGTDFEVRLIPLPAIMIFRHECFS